MIDLPLIILVPLAILYFLSEIFWVLRYLINPIWGKRWPEKRSRLSRFLEIFYEKIPTHQVSKWWQCKAFYSFRKNKDLMVIFPFHYVVNFFWWLNLRWSIYSHKPSWIDQEISKK